MNRNLLCAAALVLSGCSDCTDNYDQEPWELNEYDVDLGKDDIDMEKDLGVDLNDGVDLGSEDEKICLTRGELRDAFQTCYDLVGFECSHGELMQDENGEYYGEKLNECAWVGCSLDPVKGSHIFYQERWEDIENKYFYMTAVQRLFGRGDCGEVTVDKYGVEESESPVWAHGGVVWAINNGYMTRSRALDDDVCVYAEDLDYLYKQCTQDIEI